MEAANDRAPDLRARLSAALKDAMRARGADGYAANGFADQAGRLRREASILSSIVLPADHE